MQFETQTIFTLADFLKSLSANEYYDIAQRLYNEWAESDVKKPVEKLKRLVQIKERHTFSRLNQAFTQWKTLNDFVGILEENDRM